MFQTWSCLQMGGTIAWLSMVGFVFFCASMAYNCTTGSLSAQAFIYLSVILLNQKYYYTLSSNITILFATEHGSKSFPLIHLIIAGSDSGGGAGIQADLKTFAALGVFGTSAVTALTAQNTQGVHGIHEVPADFVSKQICAVLDDLKVNVVKIGMLPSVQVRLFLLSD